DSWANTHPNSTGTGAGVGSTASGAMNTAASMTYNAASVSAGAAQMAYGTAVGDESHKKAGKEAVWGKDV
ncbi:hypothetical protein EUX98_g8779, partial [Antrodiella citrinella]